MSRIRGIEVKVQKEVLQTRKYGLNEILVNNNNVEEQSSDSKDDNEQNQIGELLQKLPKLDKVFEVHRKIGEGTFSSVYLGSLRAHGGVPRSERRWFAIKHLVPTAHPARVEHELRCLRDIGCVLFHITCGKLFHSGKDHVIGVDLCLRHLDTIVFIMPYIPHRKFSEYVGSMDAGELRSYMRALLTALRHVHSFGVIHRDVKPSNFLYDRENRRYLLVDFGLAQRLCPAPGDRGDQEEPGDRGDQEQGDHRKRPRDQEASVPATKRVALDLSGPACSRAPLSSSPDETLGSRCACWGVGGVCGACDRLGAARAPRAGTQGYRPPEVLLKVGRQGTAVDVWACGVVLASVLSSRYPFLRAAGGDVGALAELAELLGSRDLARAAHSLGRRIVTSSPRRGLCLRKLTARLRGAPPAPAPAPALATAPPCACRLPPQQCICRDENVKPERFTPGALVCGFPDSAFSLCARLLQPDPRRRPSAAGALRHPFLVDS